VLALCATSVPNLVRLSQVRLVTTRLTDGQPSRTEHPHKTSSLLVNRLCARCVLDFELDLATFDLWSISPLIRAARIEPGVSRTQCAKSVSNSLIGYRRQKCFTLVSADGN